MRAVLASAVAAAALTLAGGAQGAITVMGGGLAQACSQQVKLGRADRPLFELCSRSIAEEALRRKDRAGTYVNRGIVSLRMRELDDALSDFRRAENLSPSVGEIFVNRGAALIGKDQYVEALAEIEKGITLGVEEPHKAYYNRAIAREGLDDMKGAYLDYRKAAELDPEWTLPAKQLTRFTVTRR